MKWIVLMEAWAWLKNVGFLVESPGLAHDFYFISRRGEAITSRADFSKYRNAGLLPKGQLHPTIASKVYPAFLRGDYDTAVFEAFREVEVGVREGGGYSPSDTGVDLMRKAFRPEDKNKPNSGSGALTDKQLQLPNRKRWLTSLLERLDFIETRSVIVMC